MKSKVVKENKLGFFKLLLRFFAFFLILFFSLLAPIILLAIYALSFLAISKNLRLRLRVKIFNLVYRSWHKLNKALLLFNTAVNVTGDLSSLQKENHYIVISNHVSGLDILLTSFIQPYCSPLVFMMKKELLWRLPLFSWAANVNGFPFLTRRKSKKDLNRIAVACERVKYFGNSLLIYPEGTRFTQKRKNQLGSTYKNLLRPKVGGLAKSLLAMKNYADGLVDLTIVYSGKRASLMALLKGEISEIHLHVRLIELDDSFIGDYASPRFRKDFSAKVNNLWQQKDRLIEQLKEQ